MEKAENVIYGKVTPQKSSSHPSQSLGWASPQHLDTREVSAVNYISSISLASLRLSFKIQSPGWQHLINVVLILPDPLATKG